MSRKLSHGGGRGPWATPKSGMVPSPAAAAGADSMPITIIKPRLATRPKNGPTQGISKRMVFGA